MARALVEQKLRVDGVGPASEGSDTKMTCP